MNQELENFAISVLMIVAGILLKKGLIPNTNSQGKLWWMLIVVGCLNILFNIILLISRK